MTDGRTMLRQLLGGCGPEVRMSEATRTQSLPFLVIEDDLDEQDTMGRLFQRSDANVVLRHIPVKTLRDNLQSTIEALRSLFNELADEPGDVQLREAQVGFEVSASGGIQLIGTAEVGAKGAITLVFRRD
jgi:hypothetical protein